MRAVSDFDLERFLVDDVDEAERAAIAAAVDADPELRVHLETRRAQQGAWQARALPPPWLPVSTTSPGWLSWLTGMVAGRPVWGLVGAAACALLFVRLGAPSTSSVRARGDGAGVTLVVRRDGQTFRHHGEPLRPGDQIRVGRPPSLPDHGFAAVVAVDERGTVSVLDCGVDTVAASEAWLPGSYVLDDSEGVERWWVLTSSRPIGCATMRGLPASDLDTALRRRVPDGTLSTFTLEKEPAP